MRQSRAMSALEAAVNVSAGFLVALGTQVLLFPTIGLQATLTQNLTLSGVFTGVSLARTYLLRRLFVRLGARGARLGAAGTAGPVPKA